MKSFFIFFIGLMVGACVTACIIYPSKQYADSKRAQVIKQDSSLVVEQPEQADDSDKQAGTIIGDWNDKNNNSKVE